MIFIGIILGFSGCAISEIQYQSSDGSKSYSPVNHDNLLHDIYLIGDAGNAAEGQPLSHFESLRLELNNKNKNTTVLFLGDNIYENGMPKKNDPERALSEHRINAQLNIVKNFKGQAVFIPGNHDYYSDGVAGVERQEDYIKEMHDEKDAFLPKKGCPMEKIDLDENTLLLIVDSQWYLENWDHNPTMNDNCEIKSRTKFFAEFESTIKKNSTKNIILAMHHPLFTNGPHGGQFSFKSQFSPVGNFPLPGLGSLVNLLRKTSGLSPQDLQHPRYREFRNRLITILQRAERVAVVSGHEHSLQYIHKDNIVQIISGSGSKSSAVRLTKDAAFSFGGLGYSKIGIHPDGKTFVQFYDVTNNKNELIFQQQLFEAFEKPAYTNYTENQTKTTKTSIYSIDEVNKSKLFTTLWGQHYRRYYGMEIVAKNVTLDTLYGGLTPTRKGGGNQSRSLRLEDKSGREYVMRALRKSATQYIQAVAFKDQYVEGQFDDTFTEALLMDIYTTAHPYAPFTIGALADAVELYHTNPKLFYVPKQKALLHFNESFGDELYMIEERADSGHGHLASFGYSDELISTDDLLNNLRKSDDYQLDESTYIRARLFDMLIGDWDRHEDQWRWAAFEENKKTIYKPVPRDRDQAFSNNDGFMLGVLTRIIPALKLMQTYDKDIRSVKWFNLEPYPLDISLLQQSTNQDWLVQAQKIQDALTEQIIDMAFRQMPNEIQDDTVEDIKLKLKGRLQNLEQIAQIYYEHLAKFAVVKGNDKDNWFAIERLPNGKTQVVVFNIKDGNKGSKTFDRTFYNSETKEIWIYGLDDDDVFEIFGDQSDGIPIRIIGGQNNDTFDIVNGKKVTIYDQKRKKNTFITKNGRLKLQNDYEVNTYNHKKLKNSQNLLVPVIGSNPDDGFKIGASTTYTGYGFERNPFTYRYGLSLVYFNSHNGFDINYNGEWANIMGAWNLSFTGRFTSSNFSMNHYGLGNETINYEDLYNDDYHRVRTKITSFNPAIKKVSQYGNSIELGGLYERISVEQTPNRFIATLPYDLYNTRAYIGVRSVFHFENFDYKGFPTLGMESSLEAGWKQDLDNAANNYGFLKPSLGINYKLNNNGNVVLASKFAAHIIIGDNFEFYNGASIGGSDGLRGYRNQRFTGNSSYYQNTDLRMMVKRFKTGLFPMQFGLYGGFDYGRVWVEGESSKDWKTSYGGGLWFVGADLINLNTAVFKSNEGYYVNFGLGFEF